MSAVFDAGVIVKWFVDDPLTEDARDARLAHRPAVAPSLVLVEVANALRRYVVRSELDPATAQEDLSLVPAVVELVDHSDHVEEAFAMACRLNLSMTDCLYAVLARRRNLPLITADRKLARKLADMEELVVHLLGSEQE